MYGTFLPYRLMQSTYIIFDVQFCPRLVDEAVCFCLQFIYTLELDKNAHLLICISVFITKVILISRDPDDTESGRTVHTFSLVIRIHGLIQ